MKIKYLSILSAMAIVMASCDHNQSKHGEEISTNSHEDIDEIHFEPRQAEMCGVKTDTVSAGYFADVIHVNGEVLAAPQSLGVVSAPVAGRVTLSRGISEGAQVGRGSTVAVVSAEGMAGGDANAANRIALEAARVELERITPLRDAGIVTASEYAAAKQAYDQAVNATRGGASGAVASPIAGTITSLAVSPGQYVEAGERLATVSNLDRLTLRADLPVRYSSQLHDITAATFTIPSNERVFTTSSPVSNAGSGVASGYIPVYFNIDNIGGILPGSYADVYLESGRRKGVVSVPSSAVVERLGAMFVYVKISDHGYQRRRVTAGGTDGARIEIVSGLQPGEIVVTEGTTFIRLAETSGVAPQGHTHNH